jgi:perosamine synthetase
MMIPRRDYLFYPGEMRDILRAALAGRFGEGPEVAAFERAFAAHVGARHAIATATGRQGMELLLQSRGLAPGDEVIVPAYTLLDLLKLLRHHGLVPVPVDVRPDSFNLDPALVAAAVGPRTRAIIGCHLFGLPFDVDAVAAVAARHGLALIEDCAHAAGARYAGRPVGTFGAGGFFSLEVIKPVNCFGGGVITTNDDAVADFCRRRLAQFPVDRVKVLRKMLIACAEQTLLRSPLYGPMVSLLGHGWTRALLTRLYLTTHAATRATDTRFANVQAVVGLGQLPDLDARNRRRAELASILIDRLDPAIRVQGMRNAECGMRNPRYESVWYFLVADTGVDAAALRRRLVEEGVDVGVGAEITDDCGQDPARFPVTARLLRTAIQVPLYTRLKPYQMRRIADAINRTVRRMR